MAGFRELGRKLSRFSLRRKLRRHAAERTVALTALGQRACEENLDLTAFGDLRDQLARLDARAGELSQTTSKLENERAALDQKRRADLDRFAARRRAEEDKKNPIDTALGANRAHKSRCEQTIKQAGSQLAALADKLAGLEREIASPTKQTEPQRLAAAQEQRSRLATAQNQITANLTAARAELPGLAAEEARLTGESQGYADKIAAIDTEQRAALAQIDAAMSRLRSECEGTSRQAKAVQTQRAEGFASLGAALYESRTSAQVLAEHVTRVASVDRARAETDSGLDASMSETRSIASGTMLKFWCVLIGMPLLLAGLGAGTYHYRNTRPLVGSDVAGVSRSAEAVRQDEATRLIRHFVEPGSGRDPKFRASAVAILKADILTIGSTADASNLPALIRILRSSEAELRSAAADAIGMIGPTQAATKELTPLLNDPDRKVVAAAQRALAKAPH